MTRKWKPILWGVGMLVLVLIGVTAVMAITPLDPTDTWNVTPVNKTFPGDRACPAGSTLVKDQFQSVTDGVGDTTASATYTIEGRSVTVNLTIHADNSFDFQVVGGLMPQMFVKGSNYLLYQYEPPVSGATNTGPVSYDAGLHDGVNPENDTVYQDVSHLDFCLVARGDPLTAIKKALGSYDRSVKWTLDKSVDDNEHLGFAGQVAGSSNWSVVATKEETSSNFQVVGEIRIDNPNPYAVPFTVVDTLDDGTAADVTCPVSSVPANSNIICGYIAHPDDASATLNTAVITPTDPRVDGVTATAAISWKEHLTGYDSGTLSDPRFSYSELISSSTTKTFPEEFTCPADVSLYVNGFYHYSVTNIAYLNDNIDLEDSASVNVMCKLPALKPVKTAEGKYDRKVTWKLEKSVDPDSHTGFIGGSAGSSTWTVVATKSVVYENYRVEGSIRVINMAAIPQTFTLSDVLDTGETADITCPTYTVLASSYIDCSYIVHTEDDSATENTVTLTAPGNKDMTHTVPVSWTEQLVGYESGTLTDPRFEFSKEISDSYTKTFEEEFVCPTSKTLYDKDGKHTFEVVNTARLNGGIGLEDSAKVTVTCYMPNFKKTAETSFTRKYTWNIKKSADQKSLTLSEGQQFLVNYSVTVSATFVDSAWKVQGEIFIRNTHPTQSLTVNLTDVITGGITPTLACGGTLVVPPQTLSSCAYSADLPDASPRTNTASFTLNGVTFTAEAAIDFGSAAVNHIDRCIDVTDSQVGTLGTVCFGEQPKTFTYSRKVGPYAECGEYKVNNTAHFVTNDTQTEGSDSWTVTVTVPCRGCTLTPGYWKTHSKYGPAPYDDTWDLVDEDGAFFGSGSTWLQALGTPPAGNAYWILSRAYVAAYLNKLNGAYVPSNVQDALTHAEFLLDNYDGTPNGMDAIKGAIRQDFIQTATLLDNYNNGYIGPGHCSE